MKPAFERIHVVRGYLPTFVCAPETAGQPLKPLEDLPDPRLCLSAHRQGCCSLGHATQIPWTHDLRGASPLAAGRCGHAAARLGRGCTKGCSWPDLSILTQAYSARDFLFDRCSKIANACIADTEICHLDEALIPL